MSRLRTLFLIVFVLMVITRSPSHAINFAAGAKLPDGLVFNLYPYWYSADRSTNNNGNATTNNLGMNRYGMSVGASYYANNWMFNMVVPTGNLQVNSLLSENGGIGDIQLRAGYFVPVDSVTILPVLFIKAPTGNYDRNRPVNFGDGQTDLTTELYLYKLFGKLSVDALLKYSVRLRNPDSDVTPGNEFSTECLTTWKIADNFRAGPALNFRIGDNIKQGGHTLTDSGLMKLSVGGELYYRGFPKARLSLAAYKDVVTRNSTEGLMVQSRIVIPF